ncbi:hypothetical protein BH23ACT11_BH23ACT11_17890 [soil metagenome]
MEMAKMLAKLYLNDLSDGRECSQAFSNPLCCRISREMPAQEPGGSRCFSAVNSNDLILQD